MAASPLLSVLIAPASVSLGPPPTGIYWCDPADQKEVSLRGTLGCFATNPRNQTVLPFAAGRENGYGYHENDLEQCARFCNTNYYTLAGVCGSTGCFCGNHTTLAPAPLPSAACSTVQPPHNATPCIGNASEGCGAPGLIRVYRPSCITSKSPGRYVCPLAGTRFVANGSDVGYRGFMDCFGQADVDGMYVNDHFAVQPHFSLLCNISKNVSGYYCSQAVQYLRGFAESNTSNCLGYHCYEVVLSYAAVVEAGVPAPLGLAALAAFKAKVKQGVRSQVGHQAKVENHGIDAAVQQVYAAKVFPDLHDPSWDTIPRQLFQNWVHGHALDESAINYDGISMVRLVQFLELSAGGPDDLRSDQFKAFVHEFADALTPAGCLSNHGGGLQDDGQGHCNGAYLFTYFFEHAATVFQRSDPAAASYFKWAARAMFRGLFPRDDFGSFYWTPVRAFMQEQEQMKVGPIPVPALADIRSKVIYKQEYGHAPNHVDSGPVPKKVVLCASRAPGSAYIQSDVYQCPPGYHGSGMQAGMMNHYEFGETLFIYGGSQTKHTSQSDADTGLPILMPYSRAADERFPWRWGQHNMAPGTWQQWDATNLWLASSTQQTGNWDAYWGNAMTNLEISCNGRPAGGPHTGAFSLYIDSVALVNPDTGAERVVDNFSYWQAVPGAWGSGSKWSALTADNRTGGRSLWISCDPATKVGRGQGAVTRPLNNPHVVPSAAFPFRTDEFPYFRVKFMVGKDFAVNDTVGYTAQSGGYSAANYLDSGIPFRVAPMLAAPTNDFIADFRDVVAGNNAGNDSHGGWNATGFGGWSADTEWTRHMTLLEDGVLVVLDTLKTAKQAADWLGGPKWQLNLASNCSGVDPISACNVTARQPGDDWFDLTGFGITTNFVDRLAGRLPKPLNLVAKFGGASGAEHGVASGWQAPPSCISATNCTWVNPPKARHPSPWAGWPWQTLYSKQRITAGERAAFVSVFVPYEQAAAGPGTAAAIAGNIRIETGASAEDAVVTLTAGAPGLNRPASRTTVITMDVRGGWIVTRA